MKTVLFLLRTIWRANPKTIYFNFKYLPWQQAIQLPVWVSHKTYFRKVAGSVRLTGDIYPGIVRIGYGRIGIFDNKRSRTIWEVAGSVEFKGKAEIGHGSKISVGKNGQLSFGLDFAITAESTVIAYQKISFGNNCLLSWDILMMDTDFHEIRNEQNQALNPPAPIEVGNNVWIGCRCLVLKGASIPNGSVIAANSTINTKLSGEQQVFGGTPVSVLRQNIHWIRE